MMSLELAHDKLVQLVGYYCALIFPTHFVVVPTKLLPSFKNDEKMHVHVLEWSCIGSSFKPEIASSVYKQ